MLFRQAALRIRPLTLPSPSPLPLPSGAYAPSIYQSQQLAVYRTTLLNAHENVLRGINTTNAAWVTDTVWTNGAVSPPMLYNGAQLTAKINSLTTGLRALKSPKGYVTQDQVLYYAAQSLALYQNYSITAIGQPSPNAVVTGATPYQSTPRP